MAQSLKVYADVNEAKLYHFRSSTGSTEVDFIVERGRSVVAIEVKLSPTVGNEDVRHLHRLGDKLGATLSAKLVITTGPRSYTRRDGVVIVPAALLGA